MEECKARGLPYHLAGVESYWGIALAMQGEIGKGIRWLELTILRREREGIRAWADLGRLFLCEIYLEIISGNERPSAGIIVRNAFTLMRVMLTAQGRVQALVEKVRQNPQFDPNGHFIGRCEMILGLLFKVKKKRALALKHLIQAKRIASQFGPTPMLAKIEAALTELA